MSVKLVVSPLIQRDIRQLISFSIKITIVPFTKYHTFIFIIGSEEDKISGFFLTETSKSYHPNGKTA